MGIIKLKDWARDLDFKCFYLFSVDFRDFLKRDNRGGLDFEEIIAPIFLCFLFHNFFFFFETIYNNYL